MYIDNWQWYQQFEMSALLKGKTEYLRLPECYRQGWRYIQGAQYDEALGRFHDGLSLAQSFQLPMWEFFFESWVCEINILNSDYTTALENTAKLVAKSTRPEHKDHPCRAVVYFTLAWVYYYIDAIGYEKEILAALDTIEKEMPHDKETHQRTFYLRAELAFEQEDYQSAKQFNDEYMSRVEGEPFRQSSGYGMQRALAFARGDLPEAMQAAQLREQVARRATLLTAAANSVLWQGIIARCLGDVGKAEQLIQQGISQYSVLNLPKQSGYYYLLAAYHEARGDDEQVLKLRDKELQQASNSGSLNIEIQCHLDRLYLLNRLNCPIEAEYQAACIGAEKSRKPDFWLRKIGEAKAGQKVRYGWQNL
jgi:tetratricopeptide (TPR) repeat protein